MGIGYRIGTALNKGYTGFMSDDGKLWFSKISNPEEWPDDVVCEHYEPCECGRSLEDSIRLNPTVMVRMTFTTKLRRQIICAECYSK